MEDAVIVFTARSPDRILREGGSQAWALNPVRARKCEWLVCTQNQHHTDPGFSDATEPHGAAFLIGRIAGIEPCQEPDATDRWIIRLGEYALVHIPGAWQGWRNPVRYSSLADLGVDASKLNFKEAPKFEISRGDVTSTYAAGEKPRMTIKEAKLALAETFGVQPEDVEITIRG